MNRAEQKALDAIPVHPNKGLEHERQKQRRMFILGYEQAEKDIIEWMEEHLGDIIGAGDKSEVISIFKMYIEEDK